MCRIKGIKSDNELNKLLAFHASTINVTDLKHDLIQGDC